MRISGGAVGMMLAIALLSLSGTVVAADKTGVSFDPSAVNLSTLSVGQIRGVLPALKRMEDKAAVKYVNDDMQHPEEFERAYLRRVEAESLLFDYVAPAWLKKMSIYASPENGSITRPPSRKSGPTGLQRSPEPPDRDEKAVP